LLAESASEGDAPSEVEEAKSNKVGSPDASSEAFREESKKSNKIHVQRYKGLGEMNAEELWETTMDPARRILKQVAVTDAEYANKIFEMLMGSEVPPRKAFIQSHAKMANLDI
jgi:DNA gyrase/topoisomerase IV subunit B